MPKITQEYKNGFLQAFKVLQIYNGTMTAEQIATEVGHINSQEVVEEKTKLQLDNAAIQSNNALLRENAKAYQEVEAKALALDATLAKLGYKLVSINS